MIKMFLAHTMIEEAEATLPEATRVTEAETEVVKETIEDTDEQMSHLKETYWYLFKDNGYLILD